MRFLKCLFVFSLMLLPFGALATDFSKGLLHDQANVESLPSFIKGGAGLSISKPQDYPPAIFVGINGFGKSLDCKIKLDKETYTGGDTMNVSIDMKNIGYDIIKEMNVKPGFDKIYFIWASGNLFAQVARKSEVVENGEYIIGSGKIYNQNDNLQLTSYEEKTFSFKWKIPDDIKTGKYEMRVFPVSTGIIFRGFPYTYRIPLLASFKVDNGEREQKIDWDLNRIVIDEKNFLIKEGVVYLDGKENHKITIPLKNNSGELKRLVIVKQIHGIQPLPYGNLSGNQKEEVVLNPGEEKLVEYNLTPSDIKDARLAVNMRFIDSQEYFQKGLNDNDLKDSTLVSIGGERVVIPVWVRGNVSTIINGIGMRSVDKNQSMNLSQGQNVTYSLEINRIDPLYYSSGQRERGEEDNFKADLKVLDNEGNIVDEFSYDGPSWDRTALLYKNIVFKKDYDYLKLVGSLNTSKGFKETKEVEYFFKKSKATIEKNNNNKDEFLSSTRIFVALFILLLILGLIAASFYFYKKRSKQEEANQADLKPEEKEEEIL